MVNLNTSQQYQSQIEDDLIELSGEEQKEIIGGQNCTYASKEYSPGSVVKMDDGNLHTCQASGSWF